MDVLLGLLHCWRCERRTIRSGLSVGSLAMDVIDRVPKLQRIGGHAKERFLNQQIECRNYAHQHGIDQPDVAAWVWPY